jgi:hypothetical protein
VNLAGHAMNLDIYGGGRVISGLAKICRTRPATATATATNQQDSDRGS